MTNVTNFADRLAGKQEQNEMDSVMNKFKAEVMPQLSYEDKLGLLEAMDNGDTVACLEIIRPILMSNAYRETMLEFNK